MTTVSSLCHIKTRILRNVSRHIACDVNKSCLPFTEWFICS